MFDRRNLFAALMLVGGLSLAGPASAFDLKPYDAKAFAAAQAAGKPILVDVTAPWCPVCKTQKTVFDKLASDPKFKDMVVYEVDFDSRKDVLRDLNVQKQSTLISYKGAKEVGRSSGETNANKIEDQLNKSL
ncbi:thioredoxin family protein [Methylorubrum extorquens]|uniref:thioredoxin family protein n=1 Tax=Methylorubrum extorquens TaxID=408 RepID=UPI00223752D5|nr:thioredoxin family protein [Methylorubrum extorquens]UYW28271.1 thioredoxin family protein [Methylorubrum extorquens]